MKGRIFAGLIFTLAVGVWTYSLCNRLHSLPDLSSFVAAMAITAVGLLGIVRTYKFVSQTSDEPAHVACGLEWLSRGTYDFEPQHPPLARVVSAALLHAIGMRTSDETGMWREGNRILREGKPGRNLMLARVGVLPFYAIACWAVFVGAQKIYGDVAAVAAVTLFSTLPLVLAHAGVAATDMAATAGCAVTFVCLVRWLEFPSTINALLLGGAAGFACLTKFSAIPFLCITAIVCAVLRETSTAEYGSISPIQFVWILLATLFTLWMGYGFSLRPLLRPGSRWTRRFPVWLRRTSLPLTELVRGIAQFLRHMRLGHPAYLLGKRRAHGWPLFFPIAFSIKTPIPFLLLLLVGIAALPFACVGHHYDWRYWAPALAALAGLVVCMPSPVNIGARHILPILPLFAVAAALPFALAWRSGGAAFRITLAVLLAWQIVDSMKAHPDYLAFFNGFAGRKPEDILVNSDLDWGQDLGRLFDFCKRKGISELTLAYFGSADPTQASEIQLRVVRPYEPVTGWIAISKATKYMSFLQTSLPGCLPGYGNEYCWLDRYLPVAEAGKSIEVYFIPSEEAV